MFFYHRQCSVNFRTGRRIPVQFSEPTKKKVGRPENTVQQMHLSKHVIALRITMKNNLRFLT